jgi:transposase
MLGRNPSEPSLFQMVDVESLVPANHQLRKVDAVLDLSFVPETVAECYSANRGRPSIDPELALRMMLLGVLYDLSDRELCEEIRMHAGMRWFCRLNFHDPVPDHSTLSRLRGERWAESGLFDRLMDEVVRQCSEAGLVSGRHLSVDGTQMEANASVTSLRRRGPEGGDGPGCPSNSEDEPQEPKPAGEWKGRGERYTNETHFSPTDPDARLYRKSNQRGARLSYLVHDLIDTKSRVILRRRASLATGRAERDTALDMVDDVLERREELGLPNRPEILTGDTAYGATELITELLDRDIDPHVPLLADEEFEEVPTWKRRTFNLEHRRARDRKVKEAEARNRVREVHQTRGYTVSRKLRIRSEHLFAEAKNEHGLGRARLRGRERVEVQVVLCAVTQNLKRLAAFVGRRGRGAAAASSAVPIRPLTASLHATVRRHFAPLRSLLAWLGSTVRAAWNPGRPSLPSGTLSMAP